MKYFKYSFLFGFMLLMSCKKEVQKESLNAFGFTNMTEAKQQLGKYADLFLGADGSVYISAIRFHNLEDEDWDIFARFNSTQFAPRSDGGEFSVNTHKMVFDKTKQVYALQPDDNLSEKELGKLLKSSFGTDNDAKLVRDGKIVFQASAYVPQQIVPSNLEQYPKYQGGHFIQISRKGMEVLWNQDTKNTNGVVAYLSWTGDQVDVPVNEQGTKGNKDIAAKFDDTGNVTIPSSFFAGLPKNAAFTISFIRGNVELKEGEDKRKYKFYSNSWYKISCVLTD